MTFFDILRNTVLAGFGFQEKLKEFIDDLVKRGELNESQAAKLVKELAEKADKSSEQLSASLSEIVSRATEKMTFVTKGDIERIDQRLQALTERIAHLEERTMGEGSKG